LDRPRPHPTGRLLKVSAAFGGANAALVVGSSGRARFSPPPRPVAIEGIAAIGPHGTQLDALEGAIAAGTPLTGPVPEFDLSSLLRWAPPQALDPSGRYASAAAGLAVADAGVSVRGAMRERVGLFTGNSRMPSQSAWQCRSSIQQRGIRGIAAVPFAHMTLNAPAGTCAKLLSLRGPLLALSTGRGSGLAAIVLAAQHLCTRVDADRILAGGLDELPIAGAKGPCAEGAALALLGAAPSPHAHARMAGWGLAGPLDLGDAIRTALAQIERVDGVLAALPNAHERLAAAGVNESSLPLGVVDLHAMLGGAESAASAFAFVIAVQRLRRRQAGRLLVVAAGDSACCAAALVGPKELDR
jgi:hypothetical protein